MFPTVLLCLSWSAAAQTATSVVNTKHNLSVSGQGSVHATSERDVCIFCHAPHHALTDGPLWNHEMSVQTYTPYSSQTLKATVGQPTGSSRLCLSCHDGTVALGAVHNRSSQIAMNSSVMPSASNLGTDLSGGHPVSFIYDTALATADGNLRDPGTLPPDVPLDRNSQMQCTSCHDPHNDQYGNFLVLDNTSSALCLACHVTSPTWAASSHGSSARPLPAALANEIAAAAAGSSVQSKAASKVAVRRVTTVAGAACASCHVPHVAGTKQELMRFSTPEQNCLSCHSSQGPGQNVSMEFNKFSAHPILINSQSHTPSENPVNPPMRHAVCVDCHNPHASTKAVGSAAQLSGALASVTGVSAGGAVMRTVTHEYELCFRCHGDSAQRGPSRVTRQTVETNTRRQFNPGNVSFHPVEAAGKNTSVPSLITPLTVASRTACTDCHNNDQGPGNGGSGPRGPHGSAFVPLLERQLLLTDGTPYNPDNFALCYKCHNPMVVDSSLTTSWSGHRTHIENYRAACTTCHDSHAANQPHLINFNTTYVLPLNGTLRYLSTGMNHGTCTLTCHDGTGQNHTHNATAY
jgi:predicted CXXCH cytochrome family protein